MADGVKIEWEGNSNVKLSKALDAFDKNTQKEIMTAFRQTAAEIQKEAKKNARKKTGALKKSIKRSVRNKNGSIIARVFADYPFRDNKKKYYAFAVEHGAKRKLKNGSTIKTKAYPFLRPASSKLEKNVMQRVEVIIEREMKKV